eukprot:m.226029 g.226029  ORF g.226029 m.226029 type:complete len:636 (+) comp11360_c0_seq1:150-2057(+)
MEVPQANNATHLAVPKQENEQHFTPTDQLLDFHPTCVGYVTHRYPSYCVVNGDVYVPNKLLDNLPAPVRVGRTQLRLAVKSVTQGNLRWKAVSAWPVPEGEERTHGSEDEPVGRQRSSSILAAVAEVPESGSNAMTSEIREALAWVRRQLQRIKMEHEEISTMLGAEDAPNDTAERRSRVNTLVCAAHDGVTAALDSYSQLAGLLTPGPAGSSPSRGPSESAHSAPVSPARPPEPSGERPDSDQVFAKRIEDITTRRRSVSERGESRSIPVESDLSIVAHRLRALIKSSDPMSSPHLITRYTAIYHATLDPVALGFAHLGQLLKSLGLPVDSAGSNQWHGPTPNDETTQLCHAMDQILRVTGPMPADALVSQLADQGIPVPGGPNGLVETASNCGYHVAGDMISGRGQTDSGFGYPFQFPSPNGRDGGESWALRPRAQSAPHAASSSPWDSESRPDAWPSGGHAMWDSPGSNPGLPVSPPRGSGGVGWDEGQHAGNGGSTSPTPGRRSQNRCTKLFVGGINPITTERTLSRYFVRFGRLVDCFIAKTPGAGPNFAPRSRGFGFVTFAHSSSADMVLRSGPHILDDRALDVKTAVPKEMMQSGPTPQQSWTPPTNRMPGSPFRHGFEGGDQYYEYN